MFATLLNKGLGSSLVVLISLFVLSFITHLFSNFALENNQFPDLFYNYFTSQISSKWLIVSINYLCIFFGMLMVNLIAINQEVTEKQNYFPVFFYLLFCAAAASPVSVSEQLLTNVFILFSFYQLLSTYRNDLALKPIFDAAFCLSLAAYISISSIFAFPLFYVMLFVLRPFVWREWLVALLGMLVPIFTYESVAYLSNFNQAYLFETGLLFLNSLRMPSISEYYMPLLLVLVFLFLLSIFQSFSGGFGNTVKKQRAKIILLWYIFFSSLSVFSSGASGSAILITCAFPLSFFIGDYFYFLKQKKISNTILVVLLLCSLLIYLGKIGLI